MGTPSSDEVLRPQEQRVRRPLYLAAFSPAFALCNQERNIWGLLVALGTLWNSCFKEEAQRLGSVGVAETDEAMTTAGVQARPGNRGAWEDQPPSGQGQNLWPAVEGGEPGQGSGRPRASSLPRVFSKKERGRAGERRERLRLVEFSFVGLSGADFHEEREDTVPDPSTSASLSPGTIFL